MKRRPLGIVSHREMKENPPEPANGSITKAVRTTKRHGAGEKQWEMPTPLALEDMSPRELIAWAEEKQPLTHLAIRARQLAMCAEQISEGAVRQCGEYMHALFMQAIPDGTWRQLRAFLRWGALAQNAATKAQPAPNPAEVVRHINRRSEAVLRAMWDGAMTDPHRCARDIHQALYHAKRLGLDVEQAFGDADHAAKGAA